MPARHRSTSRSRSRSPRRRSRSPARRHERRARDPSPKNNRGDARRGDGGNARQRSPIMRGPSGVPLAKNVVSELALEAVVQDPKKRSGEGGFDNSAFSNQGLSGGGARRSGFGSSVGFGDNQARRPVRGAGAQGFGRSFGGRDGPQRAGFNGGPQGGRLSGRVTRPGGGGFDDREGGIRRRVTLPREDPDKPVLLLDDPASVPKGRSYFEHDSRGADEDHFDRRGGRRDDWRDRRTAQMYDPRFDYGGERGRRDRRPRIDYDRDERRAAAPLGWRNASGHDDRETSGRTFSNRGYDDEYSRPRKRPAAESDVWEHDKFFEVVDQEQEELQNIVKKEAEEYADDGQERAESADSGPHAMVVDSGRQPA